MLYFVRHSGDIEAYHSLRLMYASKTTGFSYGGMLLRMYLAVLDHNYHLHRAVLSNADGTPVVRQQCKRGSEHWVLNNIKEPKGYE